MKKLVYFLFAVLVCVSCKKGDNPEGDYQAFVQAEKGYEGLSEKYDKAEKEGTLTSEFEAALEKESDELFDNAKKAYATFMEKHINTPYAQEIFAESKWTRRLTPEQLDAVMSKVNDSAFIETDVYKNAVERLSIMKNTRSGNQYTNIISVDPEGNKIELADYVGKGKYVLLDFWASWCPPCRAEMPALVELYNTFKDKNFEIVGYSLDKTEDAWKKGLEDMNMTWPQMSDCDYWNSQGVKLYAVQSIPQTILIDPQGMIVERGLLGDDLLKKITELVK